MSCPRARLVLAAAAVSYGCSIPPRTTVPADLQSPYTGYSSPLYRDDRMWLCRPDLAGSPCHGDQTATEIHADGSRTIEPHVAATHPDVDCFYVYPTVDLGILPGNHTDFRDRAAITSPAMSQAARFDEVCAVYIPLYRQITIGTYFWGAKERRLEVAFSDVEDAFLHYMGQYNHGRKVVLIGHSQGAEMIVRLLRKRFENDPVLRDRLLVAMPIGGPAEVTRGGTSDPSLPQIPVCTSADQLGCIIGYHSYPATGEPIGKWIWDDPPGEDSACVDPAGIGHAGIGPAGVGKPGWHRFSRSYFPMSKELHHVDDITTPFVVVHDYYWGLCVTSREHSYLTIAVSPAAADARRDLIHFGDLQLTSWFGLHVLDMQFPLGDLIEDVRRRAAITARAAARR